MIQEIFSLIIQSAEDAFLQVGVFVGGVLLLFNLVNFHTEGKFVGMLENSRRWQPLFGALLGLSPGCGGAIFVMPLYIRGAVSFGTVIATLIATAGDSAFVLIAASPAYAVIAYVISFAVGVASGYLVDAWKIGANLAGISERFRRAAEHHEEVESSLQEKKHAEGEVVLSRELRHVGHTEGDAIDMAMHHEHKPRIGIGHEITHHAHTIYWLLIAAGLPLGVLLLLQVDAGERLGLPNLGLYIGVAGIAFSIMLMVAGHMFLGDDSLEDSEHKLFSLRETLVHSAGETAFATSWVFVAYAAYALAVFALGGGEPGAGEAQMERLMQAVGMTAVFAGAFLGLIPGCGPQIVFVGLFVRGMLPFSALLANAISQDGDALFPLLVMNRRSAFWASVISLIPAIIVGLLAYFSGIDQWLAQVLPMG